MMIDIIMKELWIILDIYQAITKVLLMIYIIIIFININQFQVKNIFTKIGKN